MMGGGVIMMGYWGETGDLPVRLRKMPVMPSIVRLPVLGWFDAFRSNVA